MIWERFYFTSNAFFISGWLVIGSAAIPPRGRSIRFVNLRPSRSRYRYGDEARSEIKQSSNFRDRNDRSKDGKMGKKASYRECSRVAWISSAPTVRSCTRRCGSEGPCPGSARPALCTGRSSTPGCRSTRSSHAALLRRDTLKLRSFDVIDLFLVLYVVIYGTLHSSGKIRRHQAGGDRAILKLLGEFNGRGKIYDGG